MQWLDRGEVLDDDEVLRLVTIAVTRLGIREVRFTGGEPLMRRSLEQIVERTAQLRTDLGTRPDISLTTNALGLERRAEALRRAGLDRVNVSLDSVDAQGYAQLARRDRFPDVVRGIDAALEAELGPIKVNAVAMRGVNDAGLPALLDFCLARGIELRIIEEMPLGPRAAWDAGTILGEEGILEILSRGHRLSPRPSVDISAPARLWDVAASPGVPAGTVGVIASVTDPFCSTCDRTRITADGQMRPCLFGDLEVDLRALLRGGASDDDIVAAWTGGMGLKRRAHGRDEGGIASPARRMSAIGG
jgi:GTP cyclohydrolase subunit MoaA